MDRRIWNLWVDRLKQYCGSPREANSATFQHIISLEVIYMSCIIMCCTLYDVWAFVYIQAILLMYSLVVLVYYSQKYYRTKKKRQFSHEECTIYQSLKMCESICIFCCWVDWWGFYAQGCDTAHIFTTSIKSTKPFFLLAGINISMLAYQLNFWIWIKKKNINSM